MIYREYPPHPLLARHIKCFWTLDAPDAVGLAQKEKIFPDGCTELIFNYGRPFRQYNSTGGYSQQLQSFIHGQLTSHIQLGPTGDTGVLGARFYPHGLASFTNVPLHLFTQMTIGLQNLWGSAAVELEDKIIGAPCNDERVKLLAAFLISKLRDNNKLSAIAAAVAHVASEKGNVKVSELAKQLYMSERSLERQFMATVGMSAKTFARISRFQFAFSMMQREDALHLTDIAYNAGYFDQAHFTRDFRDFTGETPTQFFNGSNEMATLFAG
ncbi:MAG: helix-turn-helix domain-containing protein [Bacteroidota bacterium]